MYDGKRDKTLDRFLQQNRDPIGVDIIAAHTS